MAAIPPGQIVNKIMEAINQSGGTPAFLSQKVQSHPREFLVNYLGNSYTIWVYIWTLTHGGRATLPNEFRIQMTSVSSPLPLNPRGMTVLMGYHKDLDVFAGFDLNKHRTFTAGSPSVQINISALHECLQNGISFVRKENDEIAIGVRPDQFLLYCLNSQNLHRLGSEEHLPELLTQASANEDIPEDSIENLAADRKEVINTVKRYSRDANFRKTVLNAYEQRCAVTRAQLKLVDAAHILPVAAPDSSDHVSNGVSLSPTIHRAFDNCLIYINEEYRVMVNEQKAQELVDGGTSHGLDEFRNIIDCQIHLPHDVNQRPNIQYIQLANKFRRIPGY